MTFVYIIGKKYIENTLYELIDFKDILECNIIAIFLDISC